MTTINTMNIGNTTHGHGRTHAECSCCGNLFPIETMTRTISRRRGNRGRLMCHECATRNLNYHAQNDLVVGTCKVHEVLEGIEWECSYTDDFARSAIFEYDFIPTHDGSLRSDGEGMRYGYWDENTCEYVSPIMNGLNKASKFALTCEYLIDNGHMMLNDSCGTHFHVSVNSMKDANGSNVGHNSYMDMVRRFYHSLFIPLTMEMKADRETTKRVFGRYFQSDYCKEINLSSRPESDRYLWVNVKANNNIEFRLNKFTGAKQYQNLMKMEVEMVKCIVKNFCEHFMDEDIDTKRYFRQNPDGTPMLVNGERIPSKTAYRRHKAEVTAQKLVRIYKKYANS